MNLLIFFKLSRPNLCKQKGLNTWFSKLILLFFKVRDALEVSLAYDSDDEDNLPLVKVRKRKQSSAASSAVSPKKHRRGRPSGSSSSSSSSSRLKNGTPRKRGRPQTKHKENLEPVFVKEEEEEEWNPMKTKKGKRKATSKGDNGLGKNVFL